MAYTNPGSIIRFSSRKGGRASIYENNAQYQQHSTGVFSGSGATQNTSADMNIIVGGALGTSGSDGYIPAASPANPNVLIGKNANGYKIMLDVVGTTLLQITKPAQNSRISLVVAYTDDLSIQSTETSDTGNPAKNGIIVVNGQSLANPVPPSDSDIRTAITADGAAGSQAVYAIIARITVASNTTTITNTMIAVDNATIPAQNVSFTTFKNYSTSLPYATINNVALGYGMTGTLKRYGDMVFLKFNDGGNYNLTGGINSIIETIPSGYRPMDTVPINLSRGVGGTGQTVVYTINSNGSMSVYSAISLSGEFLRAGYGFWLTSDAWPK